ncbi:DUF389 domain-containing protein [uncultured Olsenella sp.]|uniref:DUF389 domain-containing protein n=1 Tax=uncultured Olsenella sp. TaxID=190764 RepID=UPI0026DB6509|nr:DUF389 domain-containing protein [uncultured Olsenella sp.]
MAKEDLLRVARRLANVRDGRASHQTIRRRILAGARIDGTHLCILIVAMLIASVGLNVDSTEAVVGAMLVCPLMGSVMALAYAIATADLRLLREVLLGLVVQVAICLVTSTLYFVVSPISRETSELLTNSSPTVWDVLIALAGGFAGGIGISRNQEPATLLSGVAVATALMPPLCAAGYGVARGDLAYFAGAFYEFSLNVVFIAFAAEFVLVMLRTPLKRDVDGDGVVTVQEDEEARERSRRLRRRLLVGTLVFAIPCAVMTARLVQDAMAKNDGETFAIQDSYDARTTTQELEAVCPGFVSYRVGALDSYDSGAGSLSRKVVARVVTSAPLDDARKSELEALLRVHVKDLDEVSFELSSTGADADGDATASENGLPAPSDDGPAPAAATTSNASSR